MLTSSSQLTQIKHLETTTAETSGSKSREQQDQVRLLQDRLVELEAQLKELAEREVSVVKDSVEDIPPPNFKKPQLVHNSNVSRKINYARPKTFSHANDLLQEIEEEEDSNMRTLHPFDREETASTEFDLDAGLATMSYACHLRGRRPHEDSMALLPELQPSKKEQHQRINQHVDLRQGPSQSWDQYLKEGRDVVKSSQKRKEGSIVDSFVAGIADDILRKDCEHWLENRVWIWENVESFHAHRKPSEISPTPSSTAEPKPQPPRKTGLEVAHGGKDSQAVRKELAKLLEDQKECGARSVGVARSPEPEGNRRSQRVARKKNTAGHEAKETQQTAPTKTKHQHIPRTRNEPQQPPLSRGMRAGKNPKPPSANSDARAIAQLQPIQTRDTALKQVVVTKKNDATGNSTDRTGALQPAARTALSHTGQGDMKLKDILDPKLRVQAQKMHKRFPESTLSLCHEALVAKRGNYDAACHWIASRAVQLHNPEIMKETAPPSTPVSSNRNGTGAYPEPPYAAVQRLDPFKTPEHRMVVGRTSYKRKLEVSEQEQVANMKKARMAKKKRGPPPPIPILPSSDTE